MTGQKLDLVDLTAGYMTETARTCAQHIVGCQLSDSGSLDRLPSVQINRLLHPKWNRNRPNVPDFPMEVGNHPMLVPELNGIYRKGKEFTAPQFTTS